MWGVGTRSVVGGCASTGGQAGLVLVDEHDAVGAAGPVVLGIEQESGQGGLSAVAQVVPDDPPAQVRGETDIDEPYRGVDRVRGAGELRKHIWSCPTTRTSRVLWGAWTGCRARG